MPLARAGMRAVVVVVGSKTILSSLTAEMSLYGPVPTGLASNASASASTSALGTIFTTPRSRVPSGNGYLGVIGRFFVDGLDVL